MMPVQLHDGQQWFKPLLIASASTLFAVPVFTLSISGESPMFDHSIVSIFLRQLAFPTRYCLYDVKAQHENCN